ncbi:Hypothetical predicted protein [Paramuricea clavata]|uniref:Uncharacterized protein n=1 Tax=Paramuricea clavata TaxID=317549 RepID=A0A6S7K4F7_PARCT|nr:Hypothetical predicted protein [Paramuricea clavata]
MKTMKLLGQTKLPGAQKTRGRKKKVVPPKEPECVHISSDEDEALETTDNAEVNDSDDLDVPLRKNDNAQDIMCKPMQDSASEEIGSTEEKPGVISSTDESRLSLDDFKTKEKESLPDCTNGILSKVNGEKQKKVGQKVSTYREEEPCIFVMVNHIFVGELRCLPREPVEVGLMVQLIHGGDDGGGDTNDDGGGEDDGDGGGDDDNGFDGSGWY